MYIYMYICRDLWKKCKHKLNISSGWKIREYIFKLTLTVPALLCANKTIAYILIVPLNWRETLTHGRILRNTTE